jgi:hypothetical protein
MNAPITCTKHGKAEETFVCSHILASLKDGVGRGFFPAIDDEGGYQALCAKCDAMSDADWENEGKDFIEMVCLGCYRDAADLNGVGPAELEGLRA